MNKRALANKLLFAAVLVVAGCSGKDSATTDPPAKSRQPDLMGVRPGDTTISRPAAVRMTVGDKDYSLEVAATEDARATGLMNRDSVPADHGMIFVFDRPQVLNFWMKNTRIPLDIVFADGDGKVVYHTTMKPYDETGVSSNLPAKYAIELNAGQVAESHVYLGTKLVVPAGVR